MTSQYLLTLVAASAFIAGCTRDTAPEKSDAADSAGTAAPAPAAAPVETAPAAVTASAQLAPAAGKTVAGTLTLTGEGDAVRISGALPGLTANAEYGFHIHEKGDCSAPDFSSAGGHFNPTNAQHGNPTSGTHHAGDMLNAKADADGVAHFDVVTSGVTLTAGAPNDARGKAIVLHEKADDYATQPSGNSGARIACGVIQ